jgi:hypothetical protein
MSLKSRSILILLPTFLLFFITVSIYLYKAHKNEMQATFQKEILQLSSFTQKQVSTTQLSTREFPFFNKDSWEKIHFLLENNVYKHPLKILRQYAIEINPESNSSQLQDLYTTNSLSPQETSLISPQDLFLKYERSLRQKNKMLLTPQERAPNKRFYFQTILIPIFNEKSQQIIAVIGIDIDITQKRQNLFYKKIFLSLTTITLAGILYTLMSYWSGLISKPLTVLRDQALKIASGDYEEFSHPKSPLEIAELSQTLSIIGECHQERLRQVEDSSVSKKRTYGEYESLLLIKHHLFNKTIHNFKHHQLQIENIEFLSSTPCGLQLTISQPQENEINLSLTQAKFPNFKSFLELINSKQGSQENFPETKINLNLQEHTLIIDTHLLPGVFVWSKENTSLSLHSNETISLNDGDIFFLTNNNISNFSVSEHYLMEKVLKHFGDKGLTVAMKMLEKELKFRLRKTYLNKDIHLIGCQILA